MKRITLIKSIIAICLITTSHASNLQGDLTNGLVANYNFKGNANDSSGNNNNASLVGNGAYSLDTNGGILLLGDTTTSYQSGGYLQIPISNFGISNSFTMAFYLSDLVQTASPSQDGGAHIFNWGDETVGKNDFVLNYQTNQANPSQMTVLVQQAWSQIYGVGIQFNVPSDYWNTAHQITVTYDSGNLNAYLDGISIGSTYSSIQLSTNSVATISAFNNKDGTSTLATADAIYYNAAFYNRSLSSNEVSQLYVQTVPEPSTYALFGLGAIGMLIALRRKKIA